MTQLTPNFTLEEMVASSTAQARGINNTPPSSGVARLTQLCAVLEQVRTICGGNPVLVSSGYRSPALNSAVGGASNSAHLYGCAADFTIPKFGSPIDVCKKLQPQMKELGIDQLIHENNSWVHLGLANPPWNNPRAQALTINGSSTTTGFA